MNFAPLLLWANLRHPALRDLAWLIASPALIRPSSGLYPQLDSLLSPLRLAEVARLNVADWLHAQDTHPTHFLAELGEVSSLRLGLYAERLLTVFLRSALQLNVSQNLALRVDGLTLGALDYLIELPEGWANQLGLEATTQYLHLELALKFYVWREDDFIGPRGQDRLRFKLKKLEQQVAWGRHPVFQANGAVSSALWVPGRLFYHWREPAPSLAHEWAVINPQHTQCFWLYADEIEGCDLLQTGAWVKVPRARWLAPLGNLRDPLVLDHRAVQHSVDQASVMVIAQIEQGQEMARGMVIQRHEAPSQNT